MKQAYKNEMLEEMLQNYKDLDFSEKELAKQYKENNIRNIEGPYFLLDSYVWEINQNIIDILERLNVKEIVIADHLFNTKSVEQLMDNGWKLDRITHIQHYDGKTDEDVKKLEAMGIKVSPWNIDGAIMTKA